MELKKPERRSELLTVRIRKGVLEQLEHMQGRPHPKTGRCPLSQADIVESLIEQAYIEHTHGKVLK